MSGDRHTTDDEELLARSPSAQAGEGEGVETRRLRGALRRKLFGQTAPATRLGRFAILARLGEGGMGVVYRAYDPDLRREVALKVLGGQRRDAEGREQLLREAQALARLSHPNVVTVHEVGTIDDDVFVVMELVEGGTLADWTKANPPGTRTRLRRAIDIAIDAGRGLAAAHRRGLVHRDFKPTNVLIGSDDDQHAVRVADFGLARPVTLADDAPIAHADNGVARVDADTHDDAPAATDREPRTRGVVGTPRYMAPEQFEGVADQRSDQFGFCASFWEIFTGQPAFEAKTVGQLRNAVRHGDVASRAARGLPPWLRRLLLRGLHRDPARRHADMDAIVRELRRHRGWSRTLPIAGAFTIGSVAALSIAGMRGSEAPGPCVPEDDPLAQVWNDERRQGIEIALQTAAPAYGHATAQSVARRLDDYAERWRAAQLDACEATWVRHEQSETLLDRRMGCLDERRRAIGALTETLADASATTARHAVDAVDELPPLELCSDREELLATDDYEIDDPQSAALREQLHRGEFLVHLGDAEQGEAIAQETIAEARRLGLPAIESAALHLVFGVAQRTSKSEALSAAEKALDAAELAGRDEERVVAWIDLALAHYGEERFDLAEHALRRAEAVIARGRAGPRRPGDVAYTRAMMLQAQGKNDEAREQYAVALEALRPVHGVELTLAPVLLHYGGQLVLAGEFDEARARLEESISVYAGELGPDHPTISAPTAQLGLLHMRLGQYEEARTALMRALTLSMHDARPYGPRDAAIYANLAQVEAALGADEAAARHAAAAAQLMAQAYGPEHPQVAQLKLLQGRFAARRGSHEEAIELYENALPHLGGSEDSFYHLGTARMNLALARSELGRHAEAIADADDAVRRARASLPPADPELIGVLGNAAGVYRTAGRNKDARRLYDEALQLAARAPQAKPRDVAGIRFALAQMLWTSGSRADATELAEAARQDYANAEASEADEAKVADWLASHRG